MNRRVRVIARDHLQQVLLARTLRQNAGLGGDAQTGTDLFLHSDVNAGCRVLAHADEDQTRLDPARPDLGDPLGGFLVYLFSDGAPINNIGGGHQGIKLTLWTCNTGVRGQRWSIISGPVTEMWVPMYMLKFRAAGCCR